MPKEGFVYEVQKDQFFTGWAIDQPKHHLNTGILLRTAACMGISDFFYVCGEDKYPKLHSDTAQSYKSVPSTRFKNFKDMFDHKPENCELVGVEMDERSVDLFDFEWPARVLIVLGGEDVGLSRDARKMCRYMVKLPSISGCSMNLSSAGSMIMFHRYSWLKSKGYNV